MSVRALSWLRHPARLVALGAVAPLVALTTSSHAADPGSHAPQKPRITFEDTFDGLEWQMPDPLKWAPIEADDGFGNDELQVYTKNTHNLRLDGKGHLLIQAFKGDYHGQPLYTSGKVVSMNYPFMYGHAEARIKVPAGTGMWPAFWMLGLGEGPFATIDPFDRNLGINSFNPVKPLGWPSSGEIDVMESIGRKPNTVYGSIHGPVTKLQGDGIEASNHNGNITLRKPLAAGFHIYAVDSSPGMLKFSVDGNVYKVIKRADMLPNESWVYDRPFKLILNLAIGGNWAGAPSDTQKWPAKMLVDYVRITSNDQAQDHRRD